MLVCAEAGRSPQKPYRRFRDFPIYELLDLETPPVDEKNELGHRIPFLAGTDRQIAWLLDEPVKIHAAVVIRHVDLASVNHGWIKLVKQKRHGETLRVPKNL